MALVVEIVEGPQAGERVPLDGSLELGSDPGADLVVQDSLVEGRHARLAPSGDRAVIEDLETPTGVYVNEQPIYVSRELVPGDRFRVGRTVLEVREQGAAPAAQPVPPVPEADHVLERMPEHELVEPGPAEPSLPSFLAEETEPAYVASDSAAPAGGGKELLDAWRDRHVWRQAYLAAFALIALAGVALAILYGLD